MTDRGHQLQATAGAQITELIALISTADEGGLRLPCPGREKLGDGSVAASVQHTAENYRRIAGFTGTSDRRSDPHEPARTVIIAFRGCCGRSAMAPGDTLITDPARKHTRADTRRTASTTDARAGPGCPPQPSGPPDPSAQDRPRLSWWACRFVSALRCDRSRRYIVIRCDRVRRTRMAVPLSN